MARVLLVEDDENQLAVRKLLFEHHGHEVTGARSPAEALKRIDPEPALAVVDLSLPRPEDGRALVRELRLRVPRTRIAVLTGSVLGLRGFPEESMVDEVFEKAKPVRALMQAVARLVACVLLALMPGLALDHTFEARGGEVTAELTFDSQGADWSQRGREAAVARVLIDGKLNQHVIVFGERRDPYHVFLGPLAAGKHNISVVRDEEHSAAGVKLVVRAITVGEEPSDLIANAPVLFARADSIGLFSDVPLGVYAERLPAGLRYTVIFSNEDGGHSTRGLLARWGRTTDIEYVYRMEGGRGFIQTRDHKDVPYAGPLEGKHPMLVPVTKNNMVEPGQSALRFQMAPVEVNLNGHSREMVMDQNPWTYAISSKELVREGRIPESGDPRNYLYLEALVKNKNSRIAFKAKTPIDTEWLRSDRGDWKLAIERSGWVRAAIAMPSGTSASQIRAFAFECLPENDKQPKEVKAVCSAERISAFFLKPDYEPGRPVELPLR